MGTNKVITRNNNKLHIGNGSGTPTRFMAQIKDIHTGTNMPVNVYGSDELMPPQGGGDWFSIPTDSGVFRDVMYGINGNQNLLRYNSSGSIERAIVNVPGTEGLSSSLFSLGFYANDTDASQNPSEDIVLIGVKVDNPVGKKFITCYFELSKINWDGESVNYFREWLMPGINSSFSSGSGYYGFYKDQVGEDYNINNYFDGYPTDQPYGDNSGSDGIYTRAPKYISHQLYQERWSGHFLDGENPAFVVKQYVQLPDENAILVQIEKPYDNWNATSDNYKVTECTIFKLPFYHVGTDTIELMPVAHYNVIPYFIPSEYLGSLFAPGEEHTINSDGSADCTMVSDEQDTLFRFGKFYNSHKTIPIYNQENVAPDWASGVNIILDLWSMEIPASDWNTVTHPTFDIATVGGKIVGPGGKPIGRLAVQQTILAPYFDGTHNFINGGWDGGPDPEDVPNNTLNALGLSCEQLNYTPKMKSYKLKFFEQDDQDYMSPRITSAFKNWTSNFAGLEANLNYTAQTHGSFINGFFPEINFWGPESEVNYWNNAIGENISVTLPAHPGWSAVSYAISANSSPGNLGVIEGVGNTIFTDTDISNEGDNVWDEVTPEESGIFWYHRAHLKSCFGHVSPDSQSANKPGPPGDFNPSSENPNVWDNQKRILSYIEPQDEMGADNLLPFLDNFFMFGDGPAAGVKYPKKAIQMVKTGTNPGDYKVMCGFSPNAPMRKYKQINMELGHALIPSDDGLHFKTSVVNEDLIGTAAGSKYPIIADIAEEYVEIKDSDIIVIETGGLPDHSLQGSGDFTAGISGEDWGEEGAAFLNVNQRCWGTKKVNELDCYGLMLGTEAEVGSVSLTHNPHLAKQVTIDGNHQSVAFKIPKHKDFSGSYFRESVLSTMPYPEESLTDVSVEDTEIASGVGQNQATDTGDWFPSDIETNLYFPSEFVPGNIANVNFGPRNIPSWSLYSQNDITNNIPVAFAPSAAALAIDASFRASDFMSPFNNNTSDFNATPDEHLEENFGAFYKHFLRIMFQSPETAQIVYCETDSENTLFTDNADEANRITLVDSNRATATDSGGDIVRIETVKNPSDGNAVEGTINIRGPFSIDYKVSYLYDGFQESPLQVDLANIAETDSSKSYTSINIDLIFNPESFNKRVTHINVYRKVHLNDNLGDTSYKLVREVKIDPIERFELTSIGERKITFSDNIQPGPSYESVTGISETLGRTTVNYGIADPGESYLFVTDAAIPVSTDDYSHYVFRSMPGGRFSQFNWPVDHLRLPDKATALKNHNGRLYAFSKARMFTINPSTLEVEDIFEGVGCINPNAVISTEYGMCFADNQNIYLLEKGVPTPISFPIAAASATSLPDGLRGWADLNKTNINISFDSRRKSFLIFFTYIFEENSINRCWAYNLPRERWDLLSTQGPVNDTYISLDGTVIYTAGNAMYKFLNGVANKPWTWHSKDFVLTGSTQDKKFRTLKVNSNRAIDDSSVNISINHSDTDTELRQSDESNGGIVQKSNKIKSGSKKFKSLKVKLDNIDGSTETDSIGIVYTAKKPK